VYCQKSDVGAFFRGVFWKLPFKNKLLEVILPSKISSSYKKLTVFTVHKLFYLYLWTVILLYQHQDLQPWQPLTTKYKYFIFGNMAEEILYFCVFKFHTFM
jgi:hypothetical protein